MSYIVVSTKLEKSTFGRLVDIEVVELDDDTGERKRVVKSWPCVCVCGECNSDGRAKAEADALAARLNCLLSNIIDAVDAT